MTLHRSLSFLFTSIAFCFISLACAGQTITHYSDPAINRDTTVSVKQITTNEKTIRGNIDDKYDITIYLKYIRLSDASTAIYSVKGSYYYDKIKKEIPLVGIYDGGLTLYQFGSKEKQDTLLDFGLNGNEKGFWDQIEMYKNLSGFEEKFSIEYQAAAGTWIKNNKTLKLTFNSSDVEVFKETEYLYIHSNGNLKIINFRDLALKEHEFKLINFLKTSDQTKVLLNYEYSSRSYALGMCGAGLETGYIILTFDKQFKLVATEHLALESCLDNIYFEESKTDDPTEKKFKITSFENNMENTRTVILNVKELNFTTK